MSLDEKFTQHCKKFFNTQIVEMITSELYGKTFSSKEEMNQHLSGIFSKLTPKIKKTPNKDKQLWLTVDEFYKIYKQNIICAYAPIRGQEKMRNKFCGIAMTQKELDSVEGDRLELRCGVCSTGKRKAGCGRKLIEKLAGQQIQTTKLNGINVPDTNSSEGGGIKDLMGFVSGTSKLNLRDAKSELVVKNYKGLKTEQTEDFTDFGSDYDKTNFNWVIRCKDSKKTVIGKCIDNLTDEYQFKSGYEESLIELTEEEIDYCRNTYDLDYEFINGSTIDEIEDSGDEDDSILSSLKISN